MPDRHKHDHHDEHEQEHEHADLGPRVLSKEKVGDLPPDDDPPDPEPLPPPVPAGPFQRAYYIVEIPRYQIRITRSWDEDTVFACLGGRSTSAPEPQLQFASFGDQDDGSYTLENFFVGSFRIDRPTSRLSFAYIFVNSSESRAEVYQALSDEMDNRLQFGMTLARTAAGEEVALNDQRQLQEQEGGGDFFSTVWAAIGTGVLSRLPDLISAFGSFFGGCDGEVAGEWQSITGDTLWELTANGPYYRTIRYPGTNSDSGCGDNSDYSVTYSIRRNTRVIMNDPADLSSMV